MTEKFTVSSIPASCRAALKELVLRLDQEGTVGSCKAGQKQRSVSMGEAVAWLIEQEQRRRSTRGRKKAATTEEAPQPEQGNGGAAACTVASGPLLPGVEGCMDEQGAAD